MTVLSLVSIGTSSALFAQNPVPNAGFEEWNGGAPAGWSVNNTGPVLPLTRTIDAHSGSYAVRGEVVAGTTSVAVPPLLQSQTNGVGFPIDGPVSSVQCWYKCQLYASDVFNINVYLYDAGHALVGGGSKMIAQSAADYTLLNVPVSVFGGGAAFAMVAMTIVDGSGTVPAHLQSFFVVDDLQAMSVTSGVTTTGSTDQRLTVFPNPARETIRVLLPPAGARSGPANRQLAVLDDEGREVYRQTVRQGREVAEVRLDILGWQPGTYTILLDESLRQRFVVK
jgi:hypothetical protein